MRSIFLLLLACIALPLCAKNNSKEASAVAAVAPVVAEDDAKRPLGCKDVGYRYTLNTLEVLPGAEGDNQSLYFFYNHLTTPLKLYQMLGEKTRHQIFLNHTIPPHQWAALATGEENLKYICAVSDNQKDLGKVIECKDAVKVCEYARVKFGLNNRGNFWIVKGNSRQGAVAEVVHYGIIPQ